MATRGVVRISPRTTASTGDAWTTRHAAALAALVALAAWLRLANLGEWWSIYNDYDEGAWAVGAKLVAEGFVPYRDFLLVHPPLYEYVLALVFKASGFSFLTGRLVAVAFGVATVPLAAWVAHRAFGARAALWSAFAFACSPILVFAGRRVVPDAFAVFLAVAAVGAALAYLRSRSWRPLAAFGALLGLLALTKFTHLMTVAALATGLAVAMLPPGWWARLRVAFAPRLLATTALLALPLYLALFLARFGLDADVKIPLLDDFYLVKRDLALLAVLVLAPYGAAWWLTARPAALPARERLRPRWRHVALLAGAGGAAALVALGPALVLAPGAFVDQTFGLQANRPGVIAPSLLQFARYFIGWFQPVSFYQAEPLLVILFAWLALRRDDAGADVRFLAVGGLAAVAFVQPIGSFPRYYISVYPFLMLLAGAAFARARWTRPLPDLKPLAAVAFATFLIALTVPVTHTYWGYDIANELTDPREGELNADTLAFVASLGPQKAFATSPTLLALDPSIPASTTFDTFAYLWLLNMSADAFVDQVLADGVDTVIITPWSHMWGGAFGEKSKELNEAIRARAALVRIIGSDPVYHMEVYHLQGGAGGAIFNPRLDLLEARPLGVAPLGWHPVDFKNAESRTNVSRMEEDGRAFTRFSIHQSGERASGEWAHVGATQDAPFANMTLRASVRTNAMTTEGPETQIESGIQFKDQDGRWLIVGFGGGNGPQRFDRPVDDWSLTVLPVRSGEWADLRFDVNAMWAERGWPAPERVTVEVFAAAHWSRPGDYAFDVAFMGNDAT